MSSDDEALQRYLQGNERFLRGNERLEDALEDEATENRVRNIRADMLRADAGEPLVQWCVLLSHTGDVWRGHDGNWTRSMCEKWITNTTSGGFEGTFILGRRTVSVWTPAE